ncbi:hypothetical protein HAHE_30790 [Haloferula helveola]|uniref:Uncharacterized protein n=1 Tax=Haloferula helveola TaxID=490095 RepID=A0ABM7RFW8_9BACT|nr:hypothetical protein HAHE_30790 [Haloferula helveola]
MKTQPERQLDDLSPKHVPENEKGALTLAPSSERLPTDPCTHGPSHNGIADKAEAAATVIQNAASRAKHVVTRKASEAAFYGRCLKDYAHDHSMSEMKADARRLATRRPARVMGAMALLGFLIGLVATPSRNS